MPRKSRHFTKVLHPAGPDLTLETAFDVEAAEVASLPATAAAKAINTMNNKSVKHLGLTKKAT